MSSLNYKKKICVELAAIGSMSYTIPTKLMYFKKIEMIKTKSYNRVFMGGYLNSIKMNQRFNSFFRQLGVFLRLFVQN